MDRVGQRLLPCGDFVHQACPVQRAEDVRVVGVGEALDADVVLVGQFEQAAQCDEIGRRIEPRRPAVSTDATGVFGGALTEQRRVAFARRHAFVVAQRVEAVVAQRRRVRVVLRAQREQTVAER